MTIEARPETSSQDSFLTPPELNATSGEPRKVGFEIELSGLKLGMLANEIVHVFGGEIKRQAPLSFEIDDTQYGCFRVEMDSHMVQKAAVELKTTAPTDISLPEKGGKLSRLFSAPGEVYDHAKGQAGKTATSLMTGMAELVVPYEIVTPPLPFTAFDKMADLINRLHRLNAEGTRSSFVNAFGMHLNPEIYSDDVNEIRDVLRAFLLLYPYLKDEMGIDFSRRVLTYIDPFPKDYIKIIMAEDYSPPLAGFIADYLQQNPTRNRALDLLPLFSHLAPEQLNALADIDAKLVKARPTFHYRLPNSDIDDPSWNIHHDWNLWVEVERLAGNKTRLNKLSQDYLGFLEGPAPLLFDKDWVMHLRSTLSLQQDRALESNK